MLSVRSGGTFIKIFNKIMKNSQCMPGSSEENLQHILQTSSRNFFSTSETDQLDKKIHANRNKFEEVKIPVPWGHIAGKWWGSKEATPLLGLHGIEDNAGSFDRIAPLLDVPAFLALDAPGHGQSSHFPRGMAYNLFDFAISLRRVVKHYGWDKVSILGHSFGSATAFLYSALFPDEVHTFVSMECVRLLLASEGLQGLPRLRHVMEKTLKADSLSSQSADPPAYTLEVVLDAFCKANLNAIPREHAVHILNRGINPHPKLEGKFYFSRDPKLRFKTLESPGVDLLQECAENIKCHVMTIFGKQGYITTSENSEILQHYLNHEKILQKTAKSFERHDLPGIHHLHLTDPNSVAPVVNQFISKTGLCS